MRPTYLGTLTQKHPLCVCSAFLSNIFLKEYLSFSAKIGAVQCLLGATIVVLHAPVNTPTKTVSEIWGYIKGVGFIVYALLCILAVLALIVYCGPRWGNTQPIVYLAVCSIVGSFVVLAVQGMWPSSLGSDNAS